MQLLSETIERVLKANWAAYAALAYQQYLVQGRGLLLLIVPRINVREVSLNYLALGSERLRAWGALPPPVAQAVATYEPETALVLAVLCPDKSVVYSLVDTNDGFGVTPKEAHAQGAAPVRHVGRN